MFINMYKYSRCFAALFSASRNCSNIAFNFVPKHQPVLDSDIKLLNDFIVKSNKLLVLTGAGISTESGIPDYRSAEVGLYARSNHKPVQFPEFLRSAEVRRRYWARNFVGWRRFSQIQPNSVHHAVRDLEVVHNKILCVITQNVDKLHTKAGSQSVIELHGSGYTVMCLGCKYKIDRHEFQQTLTELNPHMKESSLMIRPDGDVELTKEQVDQFVMPDCQKCGGILKPEIVFFGDNIARRIILFINDLIEESDSLLVLGSSLLVFSGYRICLEASALKKQIAIVNIGETRADHLANLKISAKCGDIIPPIVSSI